jgi:hypothetical protein
MYMDLILRSEKYVCMYGCVYVCIMMAISLCMYVCMYVCMYFSLRCENYHSSACCCDREISEMDDDMDLNIVRSTVQ